MNIKLNDKFNIYTPTFTTDENKLYTKPQFIKYIPKKGYNNMVQHEFLTTREKLKDYSIAKLVNDFIYKDLNEHNCSIVAGPCSGRKTKYFKLFHINDKIRIFKNKMYSKIFKTYNQLNDEHINQLNDEHVNQLNDKHNNQLNNKHYNDKIQSLYDWVGNNKFYNINKHEVIYIIIFDHLTRPDLQYDELNKYFILQYLELNAITDLGQLEHTCNLFKKKYPIIEQIGDYLGKLGLKEKDITTILIQIPEKTLFNAITYYMQQRLQGLQFTEPGYKDLVISLEY